MSEEHWVRFEPIRTDAQLAALIAAAKADDHHEQDLYAPTHAFMRGDEIVGGVALGSVVTAIPWFHSRKMHRRDSFGVINAMENALRLQGVKHVMIPVGPQSPFNKVMGALGFRSLKYWNCHAKAL